MASILLVEDEENLCLLYQTELEADGHTVAIARDGKTAIKMAAENRPDLVIMDINLPARMDGIESMSRILSQDKSVPVIINTGYSQFRDNFMTWAAEAYVVKSGDLSPLKRAIAEVLRKKQEHPGPADDAPGSGGRA